MSDVLETEIYVVASRLAVYEANILQNFNLITMKESSYVESLTRITILLAKVTILFIPVSLMSTYFAVPLSTRDGTGVSYSVVTYWSSFTVLFVLSMIGLIVFGQLSGTQEGRPIYQSLTRAGYLAWRRVFARNIRGNKR